MNWIWFKVNFYFVAMVLYFVFCFDKVPGEVPGITNGKKSHQQNDAKQYCHCHGAQSLVGEGWDNVSITTIYPLTILSLYLHLHGFVHINTKPVYVFTVGMIVDLLSRLFWCKIHCTVLACDWIWVYWEIRVCFFKSEPPPFSFSFYNLLLRC